MVRTHSGPDVKAIALFLGNPVFVYTNELLDELNDRVPVERLCNISLGYDNFD
jgi:hypothetical protein